jgi:hypothetical protein
MVHGVKSFFENFKDKKNELRDTFLLFNYNPDSLKYLTIQLDLLIRKKGEELINNKEKDKELMKNPVGTIIFNSRIY